MCHCSKLTKIVAIFLDLLCVIISSSSSVCQSSVFILSWKYCRSCIAESGYWNPDNRDILLNKWDDHSWDKYFWRSKQLASTDCNGKVYASIKDWLCFPEFVVGTENFVLIVLSNFKCYVSFSVCFLLHHHIIIILFIYLFIFGGGGLPPMAVNSTSRRALCHLW